MHFFFRIFYKILYLVKIIFRFYMYTQTEKRKIFLKYTVIIDADFENVLVLWKAFSILEFAARRRGKLKLSNSLTFDICL